MDRIDFCRFCGGIMETDFLFCPYCGEIRQINKDIFEVLSDPFVKMEKLVIEDGIKRLDKMEISLSSLDKELERFLKKKLSISKGSVPKNK